MKLTTKKEIKLKSLESIPVGESGTVRFEQSLSGNTLLLFFSPSLKREIKLKSRNMANNFKGFKEPSMKTLERWSDEGIAESILGERVDPDGYDSYGSPSWLLVFGII